MGGGRGVGGNRWQVSCAEGHRQSLLAHLPAACNLAHHHMLAYAHIMWASNGHHSVLGRALRGLKLVWKMKVQMEQIEIPDCECCNG